MAESVVAQQPQRFYCHKCNVEIENVSSEYTCPLCAGGFIEELPPNGTQGRNASSNDDVEIPGEIEGHRLNERISSLLMSSGFGGNLRPSLDEEGDQTHDGSSSSGQRSRRRGRRGHEMPNFENIMQEFLISISGGAGNNAAGGSAPMFFMGNPGDYAWGREGLDSVITQMLNQMENSGPPPMAKDKIQNIESIEISDEQVNMKLQCSVCWDDFERMESVRKLPCTHIYHESCIFPWLELHGTCPVCRKTVDKDATEEQQNQMPGLNISNRIAPSSNRTGNVYRTTFNFFNQGDGEELASVTSDSPENLLSYLTSQFHDQSQPDQMSSTQPTDSSSQQQQQQSPQSQQQQPNDRSSSSRRDDDGNVEFDCD